MKIEIGESLLLSWLRHVKKCHLVQTNWKPSVAAWRIKNENEITNLMNKSGELFRSKYGFDVYKKNTFTQLMQQAEIDVIGMSFSQANIQDVFAIDVAFHEGGLNYGGKEEASSRVVKKIIRTAMCLYGYFDINRGNIIFATPKANYCVQEIIDPYIEDVRTIFSELQFNYDVRFIANEAFAEEILEPVVATASKVADTAELFMRSIQMFNLCSIDNMNFTENSKKANTTLTRVVNNGFSEEKIGGFVKGTLINLLETECISREEIQKMLTASYSKAAFNMNYPVLREVDDALNIDEQKRDANGYNRYWGNTVRAYGQRYLICSQWVENLHRAKFNDWLEANNFKQI